MCRGFCVDFSYESLLLHVSADKRTNFNQICRFYGDQANVRFVEVFLVGESYVLSSVPSISHFILYKEIYGIISIGSKFLKLLKIVIYILT